MTLNCHFTLNFHYYEQPFENLFFAYLPLSLFISRDQQRCAEADRDPQKIWDPQDCGSFVDDTSSEPQQTKPTLVFSIHWLQTRDLEWPWMAIFALNSVLRRYVWSSEVWLSKFGY